MRKSFFISIKNAPNSVPRQLQLDAFVPMVANAVSTLFEKRSSGLDKAAEPNGLYKYYNNISNDFSEILRLFFTTYLLNFFLDIFLKVYIYRELSKPISEFCQKKFFREYNNNGQNVVSILKNEAPKS